MFRLSYKTFVKTIGDKGCHTGLFMGLRDQRLPISSINFNAKSMISMTLRSRNDKNFQYNDENMQKYCRIRR